MSAVHEVMIHFWDRGGFYQRQLKYFFDTFCTNDSFHQLEFFSCYGGCFKKFFPHIFLRYVANIGLSGPTQVIYRQDTDEFVLVGEADILKYYDKRIYDVRRRFMEMTKDELFDLLNN